MGKAWRIVMTVVVFLAVAGVVLIGAAWLTGASFPRIVELVFDGRAGLDAWLHAGLDRAQAVWTDVLAQIKAIF